MSKNERKQKLPSRKYLKTFAIFKTSVVVKLKLRAKYFSTPQRCFSNDCQGVPTDLMVCIAKY